MKKLLSLIDARDAAFLLGLMLMTVGAGKVYEPLGYMVPGSVILAAATFGLPKR